MTIGLSYKKYYPKYNGITTYTVTKVLCAGHLIAGKVQASPIPLTVKYLHCSFTFMLDWY